MKNQTLTRRSFLQTSASSAVLTTALSYSKVLGANERIRLGALGTGGRCQKALMGNAKQQPDTEIVAVCDVYEPRLLVRVVEASKRVVQTGTQQRSGEHYLPDPITCVLDYPQNFSVTYHGMMASSVDDGGMEIPRLREEPPDADRQHSRGGGLRERRASGQPGAQTRT